MSTTSNNLGVIYDTIGAGYNSTRKADDYLLSRILFHLDPDPNGVYLDIGCGTGNYTIKLEPHTAKVIGIDPSSKMLAIARGKSNRTHWRIGAAEDTGLEKGSIHGIIATLTTHHWADLNRGVKELGRVLKRDGRMVIFTSTPTQMRGYWLNHYFPRMMEESMDRMPSLESTERAMGAAGIELAGTEKYFVQPDLQDHFLYCGKGRPELYLEKTVRNGMSSFRALPHKEEVESGLASMRDEIENGNIAQIIQSYENQEGDYLFIIGRKC